MLKRAGVGRLAYRSYHAPLGWIRRSIREGGPVEQWRTWRGRRAMADAARTLPPPSAGGAPLPLHLMSGREFWFQTAFCLWTFAQTAGRALAPVVLDDGSLTAEHRDALVRLFPAGRVIFETESIARLDEALPASRFPHLRARRQQFPLLRKLTDVHAGLAGWKLFADSDLLFFRRPALLIDWLDHPERPLRAVDVETCYGYPRELLSELAGRPVPERINTGLLGLRSDALDWERLEWWCAELIARQGTHYYQEQALVALLLANETCVVAPAGDYVTLPQPPETDACGAVMHHYVADSKRWYFRNNWRRALERLS